MATVKDYDKLFKFINAEFEARRIPADVFLKIMERHSTMVEGAGLQIEPKSEATPAVVRQLYFEVSRMLQDNSPQLWARFKAGPGDQRQSRN